MSRQLVIGVAIALFCVMLVTPIESMQSSAAVHSEEVSLSSSPPPRPTGGKGGKSAAKPKRSRSRSHHIPRWCWWCHPPLPNCSDAVGKTKSKTKSSNGKANKNKVACKAKAQAKGKTKAKTKAKAKANPKDKAKKKVPASGSKTKTKTKQNKNSQKTKQKIKVQTPKTTKAQPKTKQPKRGSNRGSKSGSSSRFVAIRESEGLQARVGFPPPTGPEWRDHIVGSTQWNNFHWVAATLAAPDNYVVPVGTVLWHGTSFLFEANHAGQTIGTRPIWLSPDAVQSSRAAIHKYMTHRDKPQARMRIILIRFTTGRPLRLLPLPACAMGGIGVLNRQFELHEEISRFEQPLMGVAATLSMKHVYTLCDAWEVAETYDGWRSPWDQDEIMLCPHAQEMGIHHPVVYNCGTPGQIQFQYADGGGDQVMWDPAAHLPAPPNSDHLCVQAPDDRGRFSWMGLVVPVAPNAEPLTEAAIAHKCQEWTPESGPIENLP